MSTEPSVDPEATPDDVAALLTARTKDRYGEEVGRFTEDTRPTSDQVQVRIDIARTLVRQDVGGIPDQCLEGAEATVALLAAMLTEAAFWPEQTQSNQSTYERLRELYQQARVGVLACVAAGTEETAYDLDVSGERAAPWPLDWWQRDFDNALAYADAVRSGARA